MRLIAEQWATYRERVLPAAVSVMQIQECRRAFYAGAQALYFGIMAGLSPGPEPTDADEEFLKAAEVELQEFAADVAAGRA